MGISFTQSSKWNKTNDWLIRNQHIRLNDILKVYADLGLQALQSKTPVRTGKTRDSWYYEFSTDNKGMATITWSNRNVQNRTNIAIVLDTGHSEHGSYIQGYHYIDDSLKPLFKNLSNDVMKEVSKL